MVKFSPSIINSVFREIVSVHPGFTVLTGKKINEMMTVFKTALRPGLIFSQFLGSIDISYTLQPTGLLVRVTHSTIYSLLEIARTCLLWTYTYILCGWKLFSFMEIILLLEFWSAIIAARLSEIWIVKYDIYIYFFIIQ